MAVEVAHGQGHQPVEGVPAHVEDDATADADHEPGEGVGHGPREGVTAHHPQGVAEHVGKVHAAFAQYGVDGPAGKPRPHQADDVPQDAQRRRQQKAPQMGPHIGPKAPEHLACRLDGTLEGAPIGHVAEGDGFLFALDAHAATSPICISYRVRYRGQDASSSSWVPRPRTCPASSTRMRSACRMALMRWATMILVTSP